MQQYILLTHLTFVFRPSCTAYQSVALQMSGPQVLAVYVLQTPNLHACHSCITSHDLYNFGSCGPSFGTWRRVSAALISVDSWSTRVWRSAACARTPVSSPSRVPISASSASSSRPHPACWGTSHDASMAVRDCKLHICTPGNIIGSMKCSFCFILDKLWQGYQLTQCVTIHCSEGSAPRSKRR